MVRMILGIIHYVGAFLLFFWDGLFFSSLSRDDGDDDNEDEWETYMSTRNGIFFFSQLYISLCSEQIFFFSFSPTQEVIRVKIAMLALLLLL